MDSPPEDSQATRGNTGERVVGKLFDPTRLLKRLSAMVVARAPQPSLAPGTVLGEFVIKDCIGHGGMGEVYRARQTSLDSIVAIKVIRNHELSSESARWRFKREVKALGKLRGSEHIVRAIAAGEEDDGMLYLAMEYVEGRSLSSLLKDALQAGQELPIWQVCEYMRQAAVGIHSAHLQGVIHRDIKPSNLLLATTGRVVVLDLGVARLFAPIDGETDTGGSSVLNRGSTVNLDATHTDQHLGTLAYAAPEQRWSSRNVDVRSDVYGLGATLYTLLTGTPPQATPVDPRGLRPKIPKRLARFVLRLIAHDPAARPQSAQEVADQLALMHRASQRSRWFKSLSAVAVLACGVAAWTLSPRMLSPWMNATPQRHPDTSTAAEHASDGISECQPVTTLQTAKQSLIVSPGAPPVETTRARVLIDEDFEDGEINGFTFIAPRKFQQLIVDEDSFPAGQRSLQIVYSQDETGTKLETAIMDVLSGVVLQDFESLEVAFATRLPDGLPAEDSPHLAAGLNLSALGRQDGVSFKEARSAGVAHYLKRERAQNDWVFGVFLPNDASYWETEVTPPLSTWLHVRFYCRWNTPGQADGIYSLWLNDTLQKEFRRVVWSQARLARPDVLWVGGHLTMGGANPGVPFRQLIDAVRVVVNGQPGELLNKNLRMAK